jgi:hypothetical protein
MTTQSTSVENPLLPVVQKFVEETDCIESIFVARHAHRSVVGPTYTYLPIEDGCLVSLWDAWARFLRYLVLRSASGPTVGLSGAKYTPSSVRSESAVIADLLANKKGNNFGITGSEPKWFNPLNLANVVSFLGLENGNTIVGAVGAATVDLGIVQIPSPVEEVRICRNYVAHKAPSTLAQVASFSVGQFKDLSTHMRRARAGVETFSEWRESLQTIAHNAAQ